LVAQDTGQRIERLTQFWRVATRYEKRAAHVDALVTLAVIPLWL
jgi:hypothetical protein